jgi:DNA-binding response OmpR family regulator
MAKVLIAEDELIIADMIAEVLARNGYDISGIARSVAEAIELGDAHKPDLAVIDLHLADGSLGTAVAHRLRRHGSLGVLYMTGGANDITLTANDGEAMPAQARSRSGTS